MKRTIFFLFFSFFSLSIVFGQMPNVFNPFSGITSPERTSFKNGAWVEYKMTGEDKSESGRMKFSLVGDENCGGQKCHWFEIEVWNDNGDHNISKMLIKGDFSKGENKTLSIITKSNDEPAYEFEFNIPQDTSYEKSQASANDEKDNSHKSNYQVGDENTDVKFDEQTITVPAGTFKCKHITTIDKRTNEKSEMWFSEKVPLVNIVKMKSEDMSMELLKYGTSGAKSAITETPKKIDFRNIMNNPTQPGNDDEDENLEDAIKGGLKSIFGK